MIQRDILNRIIPKLRADSSNTAVLLMGSVATGSELPSSDLDLMVIGDKNRSDSDIVDNILIEYLYVTYEEAVLRLNSIKMEVYHYLGSKIMFDLDGKLVKLMQMADKKYSNYRTEEKEKAELRYLLYDTKVKLNASLYDKNNLKTELITTAFTTKLVEAVFAVNDKPVPPPGSLIRELAKLTIIPEKDWFVKLFDHDTKLRTNMMLNTIDWILVKL